MGPESTTGAVIEPCMSRHWDNTGKPRPPVAWAITYACSNGHSVTADVCDRCAVSLVDGHQRCIECLRPMVVSDLIWKAVRLNA